ncbi:MAG TPA: hypothetical protein VL988_14630 [Solirubrobacteraceae bacterium]|nr:hypothetical protein [Solirubrobacteraceae bacterium]
MDTKRIVLTLVTIAALVAGARSVANAAPVHRGGGISLATGRAAIARYAENLRDAVAGARPDAPMQARVQDCRKRQGVVTCMASWTFAQVRCTVEVNAVADRGVLVEELGEATCARPPAPQPAA